MNASTIAGGSGPPVTGKTEEPASYQPLSFHVKEALDRYFTALNGHPPGGLYELVLTEIERPLLEEVMRRTRGNISKAAQHLGLNRATLRKKLEKHGIPS